MIIRYLKQRQEEEYVSEEERNEKAREVLAEANEALGNAVEIVENQLNYQPVSILGVPMSPTLLLTLSIAVGTLVWNFVSGKLF
jgi:predicted NBD/HSP70 family sugar kinase